jgi:hypothetical protein
VELPRRSLPTSYGTEKWWWPPLSLRKTRILDAAFYRRPSILGFLRAAITKSEDRRTGVVLDGKAMGWRTPAVRLDC